MSALLALNAGSSSLKFALFAADGQTLARGQVERIGPQAQLCVRRGEIRHAQPLAATHSAAAALDAVLGWLADTLPEVSIATTAHRVVHGGQHGEAALRLDAALLDELEALDPLAPLHQPHNLAAARVAMARWPAAEHWACFDTAFHAHWPDAARRFAIPRDLHDDGIRRYGFHGLAYADVMHHVAAQVPDVRRVVCAHLGSGASVCAVADGRSVDCSLGFTALDGLPMATRCGELDPGVIFHLVRQHGWEFDALEDVLHRASGLKGVSGLSGDMRDLLASGLHTAREAVDLFVHHCRKQIGAMAAAMGGIDALAFSGGIGEHAPEIRQRVVTGLGFLGLSLHTAHNLANAGRIEAHGSHPIFVVAVDEERAMRDAVLAAQAGHGSQAR